MATARGSKKLKSFDVAIVGEGLSAWLMACEVERLGQSVVLITNSQRPEPLMKEEVSTEVVEPEDSLQLPLNLEFYQNDEETQSSLKWLGQILETDLQTLEDSLDPKTFEGGQLKQFLGFGDRKLKTIDLIHQYSHANQLLVSETLKNLTLKAASSFAGTVWENAFVTDFEVMNKKILSAGLNGSQRFSAQHWVFTNSPKELLDLIDIEHWGGRNRQRVGKANAWTAVGLNFIHSTPQVESPAIHVLVGGKDDFEPCVGRFGLPQNGQQASSWVSFVNEEQAEDDEHVGAVIRNMKKQIKRPYGSALEDLASEKIIVRKDMAGYLDLGQENTCQISDFENLYLAHPLLVDQSEAPATLISTRRTLESLSQSLEKPVLTDEKSTPPVA